MKKKQTAVEWLHLKLATSSQEELIGNINIWFNEAKAMEKEQMIQFAKGWMWNIELSDIDKTLEQYYNETFAS
jgi:hypothetical protein